MSILSGRLCFPDNDCLGHLHVGMLLLGFLYCNSQSLHGEDESQEHRQFKKKATFGNNNTNNENKVLLACKKNKNIPMKRVKISLKTSNIYLTEMQLS